jgi:Transposase family tnp2/Domain of unknown function (DUF4218)
MVLHQIPFGMPVCKCRSCVDEVPGGKVVSQSTFRRHKSSRKRRRARFHCHCFRYPSGHYFRSRTALHYHRLALKHQMPEFHGSSYEDDWESDNVSASNSYDVAAVDTMADDVDEGNLLRPDDNNATMVDGVDEGNRLRLDDNSATLPNGMDEGNQLRPDNDNATMADGVDETNQLRPNDNNPTMADDVGGGNQLQPDDGNAIDEYRQEDSEGVESDNSYGSPTTQLLDRILEEMSDVSEIDSGLPSLSFRAVITNIILDPNDDTGGVDLFLALAGWSQGISRAQYKSLKDLLRTHGFEIPSMRRMQSRLQRLTKIKPLFIDCCYNNCIAFTGGHSDARECPVCKEKRYRINTTRARARFVYIPIIDRLKLQYKNASRARILSTYRHAVTRNDSRGQLRDVFDGDLYREFHCEKLKLFQDSRDIAFHMSLDGVQVTNMHHHEVTPVILINLNLPPEERYKIDNILASMIIPGPKKPKDLDTFLRPLVDELKQLDCGTEAFDASSGRTFMLRAWVTMVTGDGPAIAEAIGFKRPGNAYRPCRHCTIKGQKQGESGKKTYYVPHTDYDFDHPPLRGDNLRDIINLVVSADSSKYNKKFGINRASILLELRSLQFPRSFPVDIMHCVLQNITGTLYKLWNQTKLVGLEQEASPAGNGYLSKPSIEAISKSLLSARGEIPTYLGHAPRRIDNHYKGYKAAEWEAWLKYYGTPLLDKRLGDDYVANFRQLSEIYTLATQHSIQESSVPHLNDLIIGFVKKYEELYYCQDPKRLPVCSVNIHYLVHIPSQIRDCGPSRYWWQFPMERYCGIIKPMARSKSQLSLSLANGVVTSELLHHTRFTQEIEPPSAHSYPIFLDSFGAEELTAFSRRRLFDLAGGNDFRTKCYKRCQLNQELTVGSVKSQRGGDITRRSNRVCYRAGGQGGFIFATVFHFAKVSGTQECCLAWVRLFDGININCARRVASFTREGGYCWIEVSWIMSLFGVIQDGPVNLIVTDVDLFN